ncbi:MAG: EFR1 family ferrodoxin [Phycisphaerae bacterium]
MKTTLLWFSGTGNSLYVAKRLAEKLEGESELIPFSKLVGIDPIEADRVGLIFPVYGWGAPNLVARRLSEGLPLAGRPVLFSVVTCAASRGATLQQVRRLLKADGRKLSGGYVVTMPENYPPMGGPPNREGIERILDDADRSIGRAAKRINAGKMSVPARGTLMRMISRVVNHFASRHWTGADQNFSVDKSCISCGRCEAICPVGDVKLVDGRPTWQGHCEQCFACLHWCPVSAIQYGRKTRSQPRYHHPGVSIEDMLAGGTPTSIEAQPAREQTAADASDG